MSSNYIYRSNKRKTSSFSCPFFLFFSLLAKQSSFMSSYLPMSRRSACQIRSFFSSFIIKCYRSTERFHRKSNFKKLFKLFKNEIKKIIHSRCFLSSYLIVKREHWKKKYVKEKLQTNWLAFFYLWTTKKRVLVKSLYLFINILFFSFAN